MLISWMDMRRTFILGFLTLAALSFGQSRTYLAIGDSVSWGYQPNNVSRSAGDKGFVKLFGDWLGTQYGTRPAVLNLAIPGETTVSYFDTSEIGGLLNSNYPIFFRPSQRNKVDTSITAELNAGRQIPYVTFALGANDLLGLTDAAFLAQPIAVQQQQADAALATADARLTTALTHLRTRLPNAILIMPGYYSPFTISRPEYPIAQYAIPRLNALIMAKAAQFNGRFAETYSAFVGRENELTWIASDDVHPRDPGYQVIYEQLISNVRRVQGNIQFSGLDGSATPPSTVDFTIGTLVRTAAVAANGDFVLSAPPGNLTISVKPSHWLRKAEAVNTSTGDIAGVSLILTNGDIDGDNEVGIGDYAVLSSSYGSVPGDATWQPTADLNEDESVDIADYAILSGAFGQVGDD